MSTFPATHRYLGRGIYTVAEASRLTGVPRHSIRRWLRGYRFGASRGGEHQSRPIVVGDYGNEDFEQLTLSFLDLVEARFVSAFRQHGVSWKVIRLAASRATELLDRSHPFSSRRFQTDGKTILAEVGQDTPELLDLAKNQMAFRKVIAPYLYQALDFSEDVAVRWWPTGKRSGILVDPMRAFGQPIVDNTGIPTRTLFEAFEVEGATARVAQIYEIPERTVKRAVEFERSLAA